MRSRNLVSRYLIYKFVEQSIRSRRDIKYCINTNIAINYFVDIEIDIVIERAINININFVIDIVANRICFYISISLYRKNFV